MSTVPLSDDSSVMLRLGEGLARLTSVISTLCESGVNGEGVFADAPESDVSKGVAGDCEFVSVEGMTGRCCSSVGFCIESCRVLISSL